MSLIEVFKSIAKLKNASIGIGLAESEEHDIKVLQASLKFLKAYNSTIFLL
ncbi:hypothetical protein ES703_113366 [subsurface metagenome]